jgi:lipopolysaccharide export LptBFGC system permease protein LptF
MVFASSVMGVAAYVVYSVMNKIMGNIKINDFVSLFVAVGFGVVVYLLLCYLLRISEVRILFSEVKRRIYK